MFMFMFMFMFILDFEDIRWCHVTLLFTLLCLVFGDTNMQSIRYITR